MRCRAREPTPGSGPVALAALLAALAACGRAPAPPRVPTSAAAAPAPAAGFLPADPAHRWSFPADHRAHPGARSEWWYLTGIVEVGGEPGRRLGFQVTFFRAGLSPDLPALDSAFAAKDAVMAHLAVTDVAAGTHRFSEVLVRAAPLLGGFPADGPVLAWALAPPGTAGRWELELSGATFRVAARDDAAGLAVDLRLVPAGPPVLQGPNGLSRKAPDPAYASLYASIPRLAVEGAVEVGGRRLTVRGEAWMDQEWGSSQLAPDQAGWDWWSLRLRDGRALMLYALRRKDGGTSWRNGTLVERDGRVRLLAPEAWSARATATWRSEATGASYPAGWRVEVPGEGISLDVTPLVRAAENRSALLPGLAYWEGPVEARSAAGAAAGEGYVELTGYGDRARPPL